MPYVNYPSWAKVTERFALLLRYFPLFTLSIVGVFVDRGMIPSWLCVLLALSTLMCMVGVLTRRYHVEWVGLSATALLLTIGTTIMADTASPTTVWLAIALTCSFGDRWVRMARESWLARAEAREISET